MSQAITKQLNYTTKPSAPKGRRFKRTIPSIGNNSVSGYAFGDEISFYVPVASNQVWDGQTAYLNFSLSYNIAASGGNVTANAQSVAWDYQAGSAIRSISIYGSGGQLIETIDRYGALTNLLYDCQLSQSEMIGLSATIGSNDDDLTTAELRLGTSLPHAQVNSGSNTTFTHSFSIPILSSIFQLSETYFPSYLCSDDIKVVIQLDTQVNALVIPSATNSTVSAVTFKNPQIHLDYLELDPSAIQQMNSVFAGGEVVLHSSSYRCFETPLTSGTQGSWSAILPCKAMSVKSLFTIFRRLGVTAVAEGYTQTSRTNPLNGASSTWHYEVGGERHPQRPMTTDVADGMTEYATELNKAFHAWGDVLMNGQLTRECYLSDETVAVGNLPSARGFAIGLNFTKVRGSNDIILSGTDFSKVTSYLSGNFTNAIVGDQTVDTWAFHDILIVIDQNGIVTSKF